MNCNGLSEGLLVMWDDSINVHITSMNNNMICAYLSDLDNNFWISYVYGQPQPQHRQKVWNELVIFAQSISPNDKLKVIGDFNQVVSSNDKSSSRKVHLRGVDQLIECLNQCNLNEIPLQGQLMTWTNNREGDEAIWKDSIEGFLITNGL